MLYNACILDFGSQCELRLYARMFHDEGEKVMKNDYFDNSYYYDIPFYDDELICVTDFDNMFPDHVDCFTDVTFIADLERKREECLRASVARTKSKIYLLSQGEEWEWFATFTFDKKKVDRYNYKECADCMKEWLKRMRKKHTENGYDLKYMIVPEQHKDGAYHFHGIFCGVNSSIMRMQYFAPADEWRIGSYRAGFTTASKILDEKAVSNYITKYISKELVSVTKGKKRYWHSKNLSLPDKYRVNISATKGKQPSVQDIVALIDNAYVIETQTPVGKSYIIRTDGNKDALLDKLWPIWDSFFEIRKKDDDLSNADMIVYA